MRALIAEDDEISRRVIARFLKPFSETVLAEDGEVALKAYYESHEAKKTYDLIILDMNMPNRDGLDVLKEIRAHERSLGSALKKPASVIMLTGQADTSLINSAQTLGISDYMLKPVVEEKLIRELQRLGLVPDPDDSWE